MRPRDMFWLGCGIAAGFAIGAAFPRLRREFGPIVTDAGARASEMASQFATVFAEQIERSHTEFAESADSSTTRAAS